MVYQYVKLLIA